MRFETILNNWITAIFVILIHFTASSQEPGARIAVSKDIELIRLSDNAYLHVSYSDFPGYGKVACNGLIFISKGKAFLCDTPVTESQTKELVSWIRNSMKLKLTGFVPNHWHSDCMGGLGYLKSQKIESYANTRTIDIAKSKNLPVPAHGFRDSIKIKVGDQSIHCYYFGAAHSMDNIVVWVPSERILFAGCMVKSLASGNLGNTEDGDLKAYPKTIDELGKRFSDARIVIPGHGSAGGRELISHTRDLLHN
jgi:metallo-beta-lactamase class B